MIAPANPLPINLPATPPLVSDAAVEAVAGLLLEVVERVDQQLAEADGVAAGSSGQGGQAR